MDAEMLESIGLTKGESRVYLALLRLGQTTAGKIVNESKVTRSKIYDILGRLKDKGLVSYVVKNSVKYFSAARPDSILDYLKRKGDNVKLQMSLVEEMLPMLLNQQDSAESERTAEVFFGAKGMKNAFDFLVRGFCSNKMYYSFGAGVGVDFEKSQIFFEKLHRERVAKKVQSKIIFNEESRGMFGSQENSKMVEARYLISSTLVPVNIYGDYVVVSILSREPICILIKNRDVADSFRAYFEVMWKIAKR